MEPDNRKRERMKAFKSNLDLSQTFGIKLKSNKGNVPTLKEDVHKLVEKIDARNTSENEHAKFDYSSLTSETDDFSSSDEDKGKKLVTSSQIDRHFEKETESSESSLSKEGVFSAKDEVCEQDLAERSEQEFGIHTAKGGNSKNVGAGNNVLKSVHYIVSIADGACKNAEAIELHKQGLAEKAIDTFKQATKYHDNPTANFNLGICWEKKGNLQKAMKYYRKAAAANHVEAHVNIACLMLNKGQLFSEQDGQDGMSFLKIAAEQGCKKAQTSYGAKLLEMNVSEEMAKTAVEFLKLAADKKCYDAIYLLGICNERGIGVEINVEKAAKFYHEASQVDHPEAQHNLGVFYEHGFGGLNKDLKRALIWYKRAVNSGHKQSLIEVERVNKIVGAGDGMQTVAESFTNQLKVKETLLPSSMFSDAGIEAISAEEEI